MRKLLILLFVAFCHEMPLRSYGQQISLEVRDAPLETVFKRIQQKSPYSFIYTDESLLESKKVTLSASNVSLQQLLETIFKDQPLLYTLKGQFVIVSKKNELARTQKEKTGTVTGRVIDEQGMGLPAVSIVLKNKATITATDEKGQFSLAEVPVPSILLVSSVGYETRQVTFEGQSSLVIQLVRAVNTLDETVIKGYYATTRRVNTGNVSRVTAAEIEKQPVSNPLAALEGRVPGLFITQSSGLPGAGFDVLIRGRNSINNGNDPLYLVDGVPFNSGSLDNLSLGPISRQSPFNNISPEDIERIEVLKDADATAIYGSRAANGVIIITTKKGKAGKSKLEVNLYAGAGKVTRQLKYMNTQQYIAMRNEAYKNDNRVKTTTSAYDLLLWDTTRYNDWQKLLIGNTSHLSNAQISFSGGSEQTQFFIGGNFHRESTVFPGDLADKRANVHLNLHHASLDKKFQLSVSSSYSYDNNNLISLDLVSVLNMIPNAPSPYDANGNLQWQEKGAYFNNPFAYLLQTYVAKTDNLVTNAVLNYQVIPALSVNCNLGYGNMHLSQTAIYPAASRNPLSNPVGSASFGANNFQNWIIEPQLNFSKQFGRYKVDALVGSNWQNQVTNGNTILATNYNNENLLASVNGAGSVNISSNYSQYRYQGFYGRLGINFASRYIVNLTGRRDGSSRFGPGKQYANFAAVGAAWIFSDTKLLREALPVVSFGKLRFSYGTSGNDKIGDYKYLDAWNTTINPYGGIGGLAPNSLFNPDYAWEINRKFEAATELGFFKDRIFLSVSYYQNRSSNQLLYYSLPAQTGFSGITSNLPAKVENKGWEIELRGQPIKSEKFKWASSLNFSFSKNRLLEYPGLAASSYANQLVVGQPLNILKLFHYKGVDPKTGIYQFDGTTDPDDKKVTADLNPSYYGGFYNEFSFKNFQLSFLIQFTKQRGTNYYSRNINAGVFPGAKYNQPVTVLDRWQQPGDSKPFQRYITTALNLDAYYANAYYAASDATIGDASYARVKNVSFSYTFHHVKYVDVSAINLYVAAQNLFTITHYTGFDPENTGNALPPLRVITAGLRITF